MKLLAIDTSTEACSAALLVDNDISSFFEIAPRRHAELILPMCEGLLNEAGLAVSQLDGLGFGRGPGAFTGVRIATGIVQGMAWSADLPVLPVSSLAALALSAIQRHACEQVAVAMDARMNEVYWACYRRKGDEIELAGEECVVSPSAVMLPQAEGKWFGVGTGWSAYADLLQNTVGEHIESIEAEQYPHAESIARLAAMAFERNEQVPAEQAIPVYLRDKVADKKA